MISYKIVINIFSYLPLYEIEYINGKEFDT